ncbi:DUF1007 family protein [Orrella daihaiensis]|uniref:DUF1007 family protein n=1 Tax=Orrella daihaiensis TaxID=2782176 RepID=A0ABY4AJ72_9BURK|nr:DUF1007 family protein [Orrella daihaiensis]UOD50339.1 DUF1007 family protein [Orrella daihaiensis]
MNLVPNRITKHLRWLTFVVVIAMLLALPIRALAHPHMWVEGKVQLMFDAQGAVTGVTQTWLFDEMFSSYAKQGLPVGSDNRPPQSELDKIGKSWIEALADPMSHYFTRIMHGNREVPTGPAQRVRVDWDSKAQQMSLQFELPLLTPLMPGDRPLVVSVADPTFYVAYSFEAPDAVTLLAAPSSCSAKYEMPKPLDAQTAQRLAAIGPDVTELPSDLMAVTQTLQHRVILTCL